MDELLTALQAVREAISIPNGATAGDQETRDRILIERAGHAEVFLDAILGGSYTNPDIPWSVEYLRAQLAKHPAEGVLEEAPTPVPRKRARTVASRRASSKRNTATPRRAETAFANVLANGQVPSLRAIKGRMHVGTDRARKLHVHLDSVVTARTEAAA